MSTTDILSENKHTIQVSQYRSLLKNWGRDHLREFPWRNTRDPYHVLMAEFMLLRTQAKQVEPVYREFIDRYPSLEKLTNASREDIHEVLSPLGLTWRADRVYEAGQVLVEEYDSTVPLSKDELLSLPGVSQYISGAVRCFAFGKADPLIDTNTVRITGRIFGLQVKDSSRRDKKFHRLIERMMDSEAPRLYNLSMLDLGAKLCSSRNPNCPDCPLSEMCMYGQEKLRTEQ